MNISEQYNRTVGQSIIVLFAIVSFYAPPTFADELADLVRLTQAEGEQYVQLRNALLEQRSEPWDVAFAAEQSWELALAAFILNQRMVRKWTFFDLDHEDCTASKKMIGYHKLSRSAEVNTAFLLEKMWKAPRSLEHRRWSVKPEEDKECAFNTLISTRRFRPIQETALWSTLWTSAEDERFRSVAIWHLCADPDPSTQEAIVEFLSAANDQVAGYSARSLCLSGLSYRDTKETVDAILGAWDVLSGDHGKWITDTLGALSMNSSERARRPIYEFILDDRPIEAKKSRVHVERQRKEAVAKLCNRPHPNDTDVIRQFLAGPGSMSMKADALRWLGHCPLEHIRPVLREILAESEDPAMITRAALALGRAYGNAEDASPALKAEDAALLESILVTRENLPSSTRVHLGMYIQGLRAKPGDPRPRLPDRSPDP